MRVISSVVVLLALSLAGPIAGCAAAAAPDEEEQDEGAATASVRRLLGSYEGTPRREGFRRLVFGTAASGAAGEARAFAADVDTGILCVMAPCPTSAHIEGTFRATARSITLDLTTPVPEAARFAGRYAYRLSGEELEISKSDLSAQTLRRVAATEPPACDRLDEAACTARTDCRPQLGPSACGGDGLCTADLVFKACEATGVRCGTSTCAANEVCCDALHGRCTAPGMVCAF